MEARRLTVERMRRRSATTGLIVAASLKVQETVGVLSLPVVGARQAGLLDRLGKRASWRTRAASSRSEFVILPWGLSKLTRSSTMSCGHWRRQT